MDRQFVFDKITTHLLTQNERSVDGSRCRYRDDKGRKCAIGVLILDQFYSIWLEGPGIFNSAIAESVEKSLGQALSFDDKSFLSKLQEIHDIYDPFHWKEKFSEFAEFYKLKFIPV